MSDALKGRKNLKLAGITACLLAPLAGIMFPVLHTTYKKYRADSAIHETDNGIKDLQGAIAVAKNTVVQNDFILIEEEKARYAGEIESLQDECSKLEGILAQNQAIFKSEGYDTVRANLQNLSALPETKQKTIQLKARCESKRNDRDCAISQEGYIMARLASPLNPETVEKKEKHLLLTDEQYSLIPILNPDLEKQLADLGEPLLKNSMGANLVRNLPLLKHIQRDGRTEKIRNYANEIFENAKNNYTNSKKLNESLKSDSQNKWITWYRAKRDDGTFSEQDYVNLLTAQKKVIDLINTGDNGVNHLKDYNTEIDAQYYIYVKAHEEDKTKFKHTRLVPNVSIDGDGNVHTSIDTEHYTTDGFKYYYVLETVTPTGSRTARVYLGEKDSTTKSWNYARHEQIGFLSEWKRLHYSDEDKIRGGTMVEVKPFIEEDKPGAPLMLEKPN